jgi:hypothetical protein
MNIKKKDVKIVNLLIICFHFFFHFDFHSFIFSISHFTDHENSIKIDPRDDVGVDVDNDDDMPLNGGDTDSGDHDLCDSNRPRKIRR